MDIRELKQLLKNSVSLLILENGEPVFVVVDYKVYRDLMARSQQEAAVEQGMGQIAARPAGGEARPTLGEQPVDPKEVEVLERLNKEILALKSQIELEEKNLSQEQEEQE